MLVPQIFDHIFYYDLFPYGCLEHLKGYRKFIGCSAFKFRPNPSHFLVFMIVSPFFTLQVYYFLHHSVSCSPTLNAFLIFTVFSTEAVNCFSVSFQYFPEIFQMFIHVLHHIFKPRHLCYNVHVKISF